MENKEKVSKLEEKKCIANNDICDAWGRTGTGGRSENQDGYGGIINGSNMIFTVCDGMGGMAGGQTASRIAVSEIIQTLMETPQGEMGKEAIVKAIESANGAIYRRAYNEPSLRGMGTTTTILVINPDAAYLAHVGDSRIYQLRKGKKYFRTFDHSKVFEMVAQDIMTEEQARQSSFSNVITRALGIKTTVEAVTEKIPYKKGDRFILCCDGVWNVKPEPEIIKYFNEKGKAADEVQFLTDTVDEIGWKAGGEHDNLTAIVIDIKQDSKFQYSCLQLTKRALAKRAKIIKKAFKRSKKR